MIFEDGRLDQFVSMDKTISTAEKDGLIEEYRQRGRNAFSTALRQVKDHLTGESDDYEIPVEEKPAFVKLSEETAQYGYQGKGNYSDPSEVPDRKKPTWLPLIVIVIIFIVFAAAATFHNIALAAGVFFAGFSFFGFYAFYKGNARGYTHYEGTNSGSSKTSGLMMGLIGLAGLIPLFFSKKYGMQGTLVLMGATLFAAVAVAMIVGFIASLVLKNRKYSEEVSANCVGYSRIIDESSSHRTGSISHHGYYFRTSPIFEYKFRGITYKGIYDRMIDGLDADVDIGPATIRIDPDHPEDIYHKAARVQAGGLFAAVICAAVAVVLVVVFKNGDYGSRQRRSMDSMMGSFNVFSLMLASDEDREAMVESFADEMGSVMGYSYPAEITDEFIDEAQSHNGTPGEQWYYEKARIERIDEYENNQYNIVFEDQALPQLCRGGKHDDIGEYWLVFYTVSYFEYDGENILFKNVFFEITPDGHTYTGTHGAFEG